MKTNTKAIQATLVLLVALLSICNGQHLTLDSVLQRIENDNPMLAGYENKVKALDAYSEGAKGWMAPMIA